MPGVRILLLEDSVVDADLIAAHLRGGDKAYHLDRVATRSAFLNGLASRRYDLILADYLVPSFDGMSALELARETAPDLPFIYVSGVLGEELAIEALKNGATDYVLKQRLVRLPLIIDRALAEARERRERQRAEERLRVLVGELNHRVKNILAVVSALALMTLRYSRSLDAFRKSFLGRLRALSDGHAVILQATRESMAIDDVLERALRPFGRHGDNVFTFQGEPVALPSKAALALTLILHELATNASKYGALTQDGGTVGLSWRQIAAGESNEIELTWRESGGPTVVPPADKGFGTMLIERISRHELHGEARIGFDPAGFICVLRFPLPPNEDKKG